MAVTKAVNLYILTFNCARTLVQPFVFAPYLFSALEPGTHSPDFIVLSLQELAPISYGFLGGSFLTPYFDAWRKCVKLASKDHGYVNVISRNLGMTGIMVFARDDVAGDITSFEVGGVGTGVSEMGNKGAVGIRMGYRPDSLGAGEEDSEELFFTFVAAHLAPMEDALEQRNEDYKQIVRRLVFEPDHDASGRAGRSRKRAAKVVDEADEDTPLLQGQVRTPTTTKTNTGPSSHGAQSESGIYSARSYLFFAGDLNYRTSLLQPSPQDVAERFPQPRNDEDDPKHFHHLLAEDQLTQQLKAGKTLQGLSEAAIRFPPTYKYAQDTDKAVVLDTEVQEWQWARHRWPSWCDRILYLHPPNAKVTLERYTSLPLFATSDHRPVALVVSVPAVTSLDGGRPAAPYGFDAEWRSRRAVARRKELAVGILAYLALTWEGNGLLGATVIGAVGGWLILRSLLLA